MGRWRIWIICGVLVAAAGCRGAAPASVTSRPSDSPPAAEAGVDEPVDVPAIVIAPGVGNGVDQGLIREAFRRVVEQSERDFGLRPQRRITVYVDPDSAAGLEDALGLSQKHAIHLREGRSKSLPSLLPLMMHEYTHALQYQVGRLRPQWWVEGQAEHESLRVRDPGSAERERRSLFSQLSGDVKSGRAPSLTVLRGSLAWDEYIKKAGAGKAYGWGHAAVAFIEDRAGFDGVRRVMTDAEGPNTLSSFDAVIQRVTGLGPEDFDAAVKRWVVERAKG